jgi:hypothetical protein
MKAFFVAIGMLGCVACSGNHGPEEGFDSAYHTTVGIGVQQGQSCTSDMSALRYAAKYPARLPQGVSIKAISEVRFILTATSDAPIGQSKEVSSGVRVGVTEANKMPPSECETSSMPI